MEWLNETYEVTAGDVALGWTGRAWNWETRKFETISGVEMNRGRMTNYRLHCFQVTPKLATGVLAMGVVGRLYVVADPTATGFKVKLPSSGVQGPVGSIRFVGDTPMGCGVLWRILAGGLAAGDTVEVTIGYEKMATDPRSLVGGSAQNDFDSDRVVWRRTLALVASAAAATFLDAGPAAGELWRVLAASAYHDDPAAHDVYWGLVQGATSYPFEGGVNLVTSAKHQLYTGIQAKESIILRAGDAVRITSTAAMAAGKKLYMHLWLEQLLGVA
jgi:hypothetical protein